MRFSSILIEAKLLKRYKRFLADVIFKTGENEWKTFRDGKLDKTTIKI